MRAIGDWMRRGRATRGWSQRDLSDRLLEEGHRAAYGTVRRWEGDSGGMPERRSLEAMARWFGPPPAEAEPDSLARIAAVLERLGEVDDLRRALAELTAEVESLRHAVDQHIGGVGHHQEASR